MIVVDGGKGQLGVAERVLERRGLDIPVIGLAKRLEEVYVPGQPEPLDIPRGSEALFVLQHLRDDTGHTVKWTVEFAGRLNLSEAGWTAESVKAGERITVTGNPTHTGSQRVFFRKLVRADGTELLPAGPQRLKAIEEERRQRALQRTQSK